jgi:MerR family transcriptional regulator/heat shock protein HspR
MKRKKGFYSISVVAKMFSVHQQTIRMYEKEGLIAPKRSEGNTRLFAEEDVDRLEEIIHLTHKMGVNLAGVEMILKLQKKIKKLQDEINSMFTAVQGQLDEETLAYKGDLRHRVERLAQMKKEALHEQQAALPAEQKPARNDMVARVAKPVEPTQPTAGTNDGAAGWEIDYDDYEK